MCVKYLWSVYIPGNLGPVGEPKYWGTLLNIGLVASDFYSTHPNRIHRFGPEEF